MERRFLDQRIAACGQGDTPQALFERFWTRQLYEEALHVQFYLMLDTYVTDPQDRAEAFAAVENIPSIQKKAQFCFKWIDSIQDLTELRTDEDMRSFLLNLVCFAACIEGLFFFAVCLCLLFRSPGLLQGLATSTSWVFRDESAHIVVCLGGNRHGAARTARSFR